MTVTLIIGYIAAVLGMVAWVPQAIQVWRTGDSRSLSLPANLLFLATVIMWLVYGVLVMDWPIILANVVATACMIAIVAAKLKFG